MYIFCTLKHAEDVYTYMVLIMIEVRNQMLKINIAFCKTWNFNM